LLEENEGAKSRRGYFTSEMKMFHAGLARAARLLARGGKEIDGARTKAILLGSVYARALARP